MNPIDILNTMQSYNFPFALTGLLKRDYPNDPHLNFKQLIAVMLSARTKDETVYRLCKVLFKLAPGPKEMNELTLEEIEKFIFGVGFYKNKAKYIKAISKHVLENGVPSTREDLMKLPGVGRKTANLILSECFDKPAICVDVHVHRIFNRIGLLSTKEVLETEQELAKIYPKEKWSDINKYVVPFGQNLCKPLLPQCHNCKLNNICLYGKQKLK